jgi:all-trans-8'-apo-beta-carotenal 15,15'-oxygenase
MSTAQSATALKRVNVPIPPVLFDAANGLGWMRSLRDLPREHGFEPLRMEGTLPQELSGTLYRIGPSLVSTFG